MCTCFVVKLIFQLTVRFVNTIKVNSTTKNSAFDVQSLPCKPVIHALKAVH